MSNPVWHPDLQPASERLSLEQRLEHVRLAVVAAVADLDDDQARTRALVATDMTVGGIVKHLAFVEDRWFVGKLLGQQPPEPWASAPLADEPDWPFTSAAGDRLADLVGLYESACARSRDAAGRLDSLDSLAAEVSFGKRPVNLRWLLVHMVEETAWHLGHLDLLTDALR